MKEEITKKDWGFSFFAKDELDAYKEAYAYRFNKYGYKVEFAGGVKKWMVTVFNALGNDLGFNH